MLHDGSQLRISFPDPLARDLAAAEAGGEVAVPMHGRVVTRRRRRGGQVEKGDLLFTLEAMKMEHSVAAPLAGTVARVAIAAGQQVEQGAPAISIEPESEPAEATGCGMTSAFDCRGRHAGLSQRRWRSIS